MYVSRNWYIRHLYLNWKYIYIYICINSVLRKRGTRRNVLYISFPNFRIRTHTSYVLGKKKKRNGLWFVFLSLAEAPGRPAFIYLFHVFFFVFFFLLDSMLVGSPSYFHLGVKGKRLRLFIFRKNACINLFTTGIGNWKFEPNWHVTCAIICHFFSLEPFVRTIIVFTIFFFFHAWNINIMKYGTRWKLCEILHGFCLFTFLREMIKYLRFIIFSISVIILTFFFEDFSL